jgi:MoxR-like ATPase
LRVLDDTWGAASGAFAHAHTRIGQLSWSDVVDGADAAAVALSSLAQTLAKRGALARASLLIAGRARLCAQLDLLCEAARRDAAEREAAAAYFPQLVEFASKVWTEARSGLTSALS